MYNIMCRNQLSLLLTLVFFSLLFLWNYINFIKNKNKERFYDSFEDCVNKVCLKDPKYYCLEYCNSVGEVQGQRNQLAYPPNPYGLY